MLFRSLELRGAGNLIGSQQSGHIAAIGFGLYCQLLQRTVAALKGEKVKPVVDAKINLDFANPSLSYHYIEEDVLRLSLMRRFAEAQDVRVIDALEAEMRDRFGPPPPEAEEYVRVARLHVVCSQAGITRLDVKGDRAFFYRANELAFVHDVKGRTSAGKLADLARAAKRGE